MINRDIVREIGTWQTAVILATEAQSGIHYAMPVRVMTGDSTNYHNQWQEFQKEHRKQKDLKGDEFLSGFSREDKIIPVTTTVLYLGEEEWDGPRCLKDMMDLDCLPQELQDRIADYPLDILEVRKFPDYEKFQTDLQWVFGFLQRDKNKKDLENYVTDNQEVFADLAEDAYDMILQFSNSEALDKNKENYKTNKGGINMCKAIDDMIADGELRGELRGKIQGIIAICREFDISKELAMNKIMKECNLSEDIALEYMEQYWEKTS